VEELGRDVVMALSPEEAIALLNARVIRCTRCPRLVAYREEVGRVRKRAYIDEEYWSRPVPSLGDPLASVMIVGLAPAAHGANRTGRMFTGDGTDAMGAGSFLMRALFATGFANQPTSSHPDDGLELRDLYIGASVRCAPPENKPLPSEIENCRSYLLEELDLLPRLRVVVALGRLAFDEVLKDFAIKGVTIPRPRPRFGHGVALDFGSGVPILLASYHPSRQNTQTGVLTPGMLEEVFRSARRISAG
jgi:uracil-DNA glycosylase